MLLYLHVVVILCYLDFLTDTLTVWSENAFLDIEWRDTTQRVVPFHDSVSSWRALTDLRRCVVDVVNLIKSDHNKNEVWYLEIITKEKSCTLYK